MFYLPIPPSPLQLIYFLFYFISMFSPPQRPHIDPASTLHRPYIDLTSTLHRPHIDPISTSLHLRLLHLIFIVFPPPPHFFFHRQAFAWPFLPGSDLSDVLNNKTKLTRRRRRKTIEVGRRRRRRRRRCKILGSRLLVFCTCAVTFI